MEELRRSRQKEHREVQRNLKRGHLKSAPSDPDGQRKARGETKWTRFGQVNGTAYVPLTRIDGCLKFYRYWPCLLSWQPGDGRNVIAQIVRPCVESPCIFVLRGKVDL